MPAAYNILRTLVEGFRHEQGPKARSCLEQSNEQWKLSMQPGTKKNWIKYVIELRQNLNLSQEGLAAQLETNQCTVSRWERGVTKPNYQMRAKLADLYANMRLETKDAAGSVQEIAQIIIDSSTTNSVLLHRDGTIIAVSPNLGYLPGLKLIDQTIHEELHTFRAFESFLDQVGFWDSLNTCFEYTYRSGNKDCCSILTSLQINAQLYCMVQKKRVAPSATTDAYRP